jgi:putative membrane protein
MGALSAESKRALTAVVEAIELGSGAEIVVAVRPRSSPLVVPCALVGALAGILGLAFLLFSPWLFSHDAMLLDTVLLGLAGAWICRRVEGLQRWFIPRALAQLSVERAAKTEFVDRGVMETRERLGVLVYVSQLERAVCVVADRGVRERVESRAWDAASAELEHAVAVHDDDGVAWAAALEGFLPVLARALPRLPDDVNELEDFV